MELLSVDGTMLWKRLNFFLQFRAIYQLILVCILCLNDATPKIALNSSKYCANWEVYILSITPAVPRWVSHTTLSQNNSCSPIAQISKRFLSSKLGCFILTIGILEFSLNYPLSTTPNVPSEHATSQLRVQSPTMKSFLSQQESSLVFREYFLNAALICSWCRLTLGYNSSGNVLIRHRVMAFIVEVLWSNSADISQSPRKIGAETSMET